MITDFAPDKKVSSALLSTMCQAALPAVLFCVLLGNDKLWAAREQPWLHRSVFLQEGAPISPLHRCLPHPPPPPPPHPMQHCYWGLPFNMPACIAILLLQDGD